MHGGGGGGGGGRGEVAVGLQLTPAWSSGLPWHAAEHCDAGQYLRSIQRWEAVKKLASLEEAQKLALLLRG